MASVIHPTGKAHILGSVTKVDLVADDIKAFFYSGAYNAAHEFVSDLTGASIIARSGNLAGKTVALGVFDANNITLAAVSGAAFTHVKIVKDTGSDATSVLLADLEVSSFTPSGGDVNIVWHASGLFQI